MSFKISNDAQDWFKDIKFTEAKVMDAYYFCIILGLHMYLKDEQNRIPERVVNCSSDTFFKGAYPADYVHCKNELIALFLEAELKRVVGNERSDKNSIKTIINDRLDNDDPSKLSNKGLEFADRYSYMGFLELKKKIIDRPFDKTNFLNNYHNLLKEYL